MGIVATIIVAVVTTLHLYTQWFMYLHIFYNKEYIHIHTQ